LLAILHAESSLDVVDGRAGAERFHALLTLVGVKPETDVGHRAPEDLLARVAGGPEEGVIDFPDAPVFQARDEENGRAQPEDGVELGLGIEIRDLRRGSDAPGRHSETSMRRKGPFRQSILRARAS